jgi:glycosyltransferase involved in cell wall biosynthesis
MTTINILALWKNSALHAERTFYQLDNLLKIEGFKFNLFFYTNDNRDNTVELLENWKAEHPNTLIKIKSEILGAPTFGSIASSYRTSLLAFFRNRCKSMASGVPSDLSLVLDTDLEFFNDDFLALYNHLTTTENAVAALGSSIQNVQDFTFGNTHTSAYDIFCLRDREGNPGIYFADSPFPIKSDNENFRNGLPVKVSSAFGGMGLYKSEAYNKCFYSGENSSEHVSLSFQIGRFGDLWVVPQCRPVASIDLSTLNLSACEQIGRDNLQKYLIGCKLRSWALAEKYEFEFIQKKT